MSRKIIMLAAICLLLIVSAALTLRSRSSEPAQPPGPDATDKLIAGYKQWTRVNPFPMKISVRASLDCAIASPPPGPHGEKYITVYVNEIGRPAMMEEKKPNFPQGSVIVKEKLTTPESTTPELLTVMLKRERGYNPESGDWEYMVFDGTGASVQERGKLENCQSCHTLLKETDYISRKYLPYDVESKFK